MRRSGRPWNVRIALAAAFILVLQAMSSGLVTGSMASPVALDAFGNPICVTSTDHFGGATKDDGGHHLGSECCSMGCGAFVSLALTIPPTGVAPRPAADQAGPAWVRQLVPPRQPDHDPASPRAPPRLA